MKKSVFLFSIVSLIFLLGVGCTFFWEFYSRPSLQEQGSVNNSSVQQEKKWNYIPDEKLIATYLADFHKKDTELSHTGVYKIDSIPNPGITESPYGPFVSNELLIGISSEAYCQEAIRELHIVNASVYNDTAEYSEKICGMNMRFIFPPDTPYEKFLAIIQFLKSKSELFDLVSINHLTPSNSMFTK